MQETTLKIRIFGDPALRKKAEPVAKVCDPECRILSKMAQLMYDAQGIGLAAPQVGIDKALIVVDIGSGLYKLINPKIVKKEGVQYLQEGCLSVPGIGVKVKRAKKILVKALDTENKAVTIDAEGLLACVFQHEIDHLHAKLIIDYAPVFTRMRFKKKMKKLNEQVDEELPKSEKKSAKL